MLPLVILRDDLWRRLQHRPTAEATLACNGDNTALPFDPELDLVLVLGQSNSQKLFAATALRRRVSVGPGEHTRPRPAAARRLPERLAEQGFPARRRPPADPAKLRGRRSCVSRPRESTAAPFRNSISFWH
jgi:hypothetical protein